ncbi:MAG: kelch repeat-containing protein [Sandaracinaceae bacterium]
MKLRLAMGVLVSLALGACDGSMPAVDAGGGDGGGDAGPILSTVRPGKRSDVGGVADPASNSIVIFGGDDGPIVNQIPTPNFRDDTWLFQPSAGWMEITVATPPSARARSAYGYDATNPRMIVFGGRYRSATSGPYTLYNDLWAFDFAARTWTMLHDGSGSAPAPRYFAGLAVAADGTIYVLGGGTNTDALNFTIAEDIWSFDGTSWTMRPRVGTPPSPRLFETWIHDVGRNRMLAFGGQRGDFFTAAYNELYAVELGTGEWSQLDPGTGPSGRFNGMGVHDTTMDRYIVFGGHPDVGTANDVWAWNAASGGWTQVSTGDQFTGGALGCLGNPAEIPSSYVTQDLSSPERRQGGVFGILGNDAWLFGGEGDCSDHLDDVWRLSLSGGGWSEIIEARTGESCDRRGDDCQCLCL